jgi:hypothetical protein
VSLAGAGGSPDNVLDDPGYYGYVTYTAFHGRRAR